MPEQKDQHKEPQLHASASEAVTNNVRVEVESRYAPELSQPFQGSWVFHYTVRITNEVGLGLSGSVWSADRGRARALARRLGTGSVCINDVLVNYFVVEAPLGGVKGSGLGYRHGVEGLRQFCWIETIVEDAPVLGLLSGWIQRQLVFPYKASVLRVLRWAMRRLY